MKGAGMLVVSLRILLSLRAFWTNRHHIYRYKRPLLGLKQRMGTVFVAVFFICLCFRMSFFRGPKKGWATPRLASFRGLIQNFRRVSPPLSYESPPGTTLHSLLVVNQFLLVYEVNKIRSKDLQQSSAVRGFKVISFKKNISNQFFKL